MMGFVEFAWPDISVAASEIIAIGRPQKTARGGEERTLTMRNGDEHTVSTYTTERLLMRPLQMIAAEPGTYHLRTWRDKGEFGVIKTPVVGWGLCADGDVRPVTPQGVHDCADRDTSTYVLMPDGSVQSVGEHTEPVWFDTEEEYLAHERGSVGTSGDAAPQEQRA